MINRYIHGDKWAYFWQENGEKLVKKYKLGEIEANISGLQPRYEYMQSGTFANDLMVHMFRRAFGIGGNPEQGIPEAIGKYEGLKPQFYGYGKDEKPSPVMKTVAVADKPMRPRIAEGAFYPG